MIKSKNPFILRYKKLFYEILDQIADMENIKDEGHVNLVIVNPLKMKQLNKKYKNVNKTTDILSFPSDWKELHKILNYYEFGDIYMNSFQIKLQANKYGHSRKREWAYIFAHGVFHLLGYDHQVKDEEKIMNDKTDIVMKKIKVVRNV